MRKEKNSKKQDTNEVKVANDLKELERQEQELEERRKKRNRRIKKILIIIGIIIIILLLLRSCNQEINLPEPVEKVVDGIFDDSQKNEEDVERETPEERQERINKDVKEGMMTINLNVTPVFENGTAEGNLLIVNDKDNLNLMQVQIKRDDTNELIYTSGLIKQGNIIEKAKLDVPLPKGVYECTVYFFPVDSERLVILGASGAKIRLTVLN